MSAADWIASAPAELVALMRRMTWHHKIKWAQSDYASDDDGRELVDDLEKAEALGSAFRIDPNHEAGLDRTHVIAVDIDVRAWLVPSSTEGHSHLYVELPVLDGDLWAWLEASAAIGLVEPGYVNACKSRGMTSVRTPWTKKEDNS